MKKLILALALFAPAIASAQIYPLKVYADAYRVGDKQNIKFMMNPDGVTFVGTCKGEGESKLCNLAKDGSFKTTSGVSFKTEGARLIVAGHEGDTCNYIEEEGKGRFDCEDRE